MKWVSLMNITIAVNASQRPSYFVCDWFHVVSSVRVERENVLRGFKPPWTLLYSEAHLGAWQTWLKGNGLPAFLELNSLKEQEILVSLSSKFRKWRLRSTDGIQCWNEIHGQTRHRWRAIGIPQATYFTVGSPRSLFFPPDAATLKVSPHNFN